MVVSILSCFVGDGDDAKAEVLVCAGSGDWFDRHAADGVWRADRRGGQCCSVTVYLPQAGQPVQVWEDLQAYIGSFRVIR